MGARHSRRRPLLLPPAPPPPPSYAATVAEAWSDVWASTALVAGHFRVGPENAHRIARALRQARGRYAVVGRHGNVVWYASAEDALALYTDILNSVAALYQQLCTELQLGSEGLPEPVWLRLRTYVAAAASQFGPPVGVEHVTRAACHLLCAHYLPGGHLSRGFAIRGATVHVPL